MPHGGLMNERSMGPVEGPFLRARLHIRGGKRRLRQGKTAAGIVTLYDALLAAMEWYVNAPVHQGKLAAGQGVDLNNDRSVYAMLVRIGVLDGKFDFPGFDELEETALNGEMPAYDYRELITGIESVMTQLGVMPFDEATLPPEDPSTY
jgi:hypothetical protein